MPSYKDEVRNTWYCSFYYTKNGKRCIKKKRGFQTKREANAWERKFIEQHQADLDMDFTSFWELYLADMEVRLRENTIQTKKYIVELKILPYFKDMSINEISAKDIRDWQNQLIKQGYKDTYLKTVNNQLSCIMNYAVKYYDLNSNPVRKAGAIGKGRSDEMKFYTKEEFEQFIKGVSDKLQSEIAFKLLFWTGIRIGELLALTPQDIDFDNNVIHVTKSYQRIRGRDVITAPKTPKSIRDITMPVSLKNELYEYVGRLYGVMKDQRIFSFGKYFLEHEVIRGAKNTGVKKIRLHDFRHSHASLLVSMGIPIVEIRDRLGHQLSKTTIDIYSHLYPNSQMDLANKLEKEFDKE